MNWAKISLAMRQRFMLSAPHKKTLDTAFIDLDGTLLDVRARLYGCYCDILSESNATPLDINTYWQLKRTKAPLPKQLKNTGYTADEATFWASWMLRIEHPEYLAHDYLKPLAREALLTAANHADRVVLLTMRKNRQTLIQQLEQFQIIDLFHEIINAPTSKIKSIEDRQFGKALLIGDTEEDMSTAKHFGMISTAITSGLRTRELLSADFYYDEIKDIDWATVTRSII